jgi:hypothetical protein
MASLPMIRKLQLESLQKGPQVAKTILLMAAPETVTLYRDGGSGWTALEVLCHLRDLEAVFLERARLAMEQDFPTLPMPDADQLATERAYNSQSLWPVFDDWAVQRAETLRYYQGIQEGDWERTGNHPRRGRLTMDEQLVLIAWHDLNHFEQIARILDQKLS